VGAAVVLRACVPVAVGEAASVASTVVVAVAAVAEGEGVGEGRSESAGVAVGPGEQATIARHMRMSERTRITREIRRDMGHSFLQSRVAGEDVSAWCLV
jgi:hypothetical protein